MIITIMITIEDADDQSRDYHIEDMLTIIIRRNRMFSVVRIQMIISIMVTLKIQMIIVVMI